MGGTAIDRRRLRTAVLAALAGLCYYIETQNLGFTLQCPFHQLTGLFCPGCGITTACIALLRGDWAGAAAANWGLTFALPLLAPFLAWCLWRWLCRKPVAGRAANGTALALAGWFLLWGVARNLLHL